MEIDVRAEPEVTRAPTRLERVTFRGVDCAELADRYAAYRRNLSGDTAVTDPDEIRLEKPSA